MKIGIIGSGTVGGALGKGLAALGHEVIYSSRQPDSEKMRVLIAESGGNARAGSASETLAFGELIIVAMPWGALEETVSSAGDWAGKVVIDATNRFGPSVSGLSAAEDLAQLLPGAKVVKAFNTIGVEHMVNPQFGDQRPTMMIAGDDAGAKRTVAAITEALGFEVVDVGPLSASAMLESLARLWVTLARRDGRNVAFKLLRK